MNIRYVLRLAKKIWFHSVGSPFWMGQYGSITIFQAYHEQVSSYRHIVKPPFGPLFIMFTMLIMFIMLYQISLVMALFYGSTMLNHHAFTHFSR